MISRPQSFRNANVLVVHKRLSRSGKVIHRRLRRSTGLPRRRLNNFEMRISPQREDRNLLTTDGHGGALEKGAEDTKEKTVMLTGTAPRGGQGVWLFSLDVGFASL